MIIKFDQLGVIKIEIVLGLIFVVTISNKINNKSNNNQKTNVIITVASQQLIMIY